MSEALVVLVGLAAFLGFFHTAIGPDHYLPFVVLAKSEAWSFKRTMLWTFVCGVGHVSSSILLGGLGVALGWNIKSLEGVESARETLASFALIGFGGLYMLWGLYLAYRGRGHSHAHFHKGGISHTHIHGHKTSAESDNEKQSHKKKTHSHKHRFAKWAIFMIFVLGPCEPLVPMLIFPAAQHSILGIALVAATYSLATIGTMMIAVVAGYLGLRMVSGQIIDRYIHAMSGAAIMLSGLVINLLGL